MLSSKEKEILLSLQKRCDEGDVGAMEQFAAFYYEDHPEMMDAQSAPLVLAYYEKAAAGGHQKAALYLGCMYAEGRHAPKDAKKAVAHLESALAGESARVAALAAAKLGDCYRDGCGVTADAARAFDYYLEGVLLCEHPFCLYKLGDAYRTGLFVRQDAKKAYFIYKKAKACVDYFGQHSYGEILIRLAEANLEGEGCERDVASARKYFALANRAADKSECAESIRKRVAAGLARADEL